MTKLSEHMPDLKRNFARSVFSACAFNFGPQVTTFAHHNCMNLPYGLCAVQAFGSYNHTKGGHLVLPELGLIIEFPPGALILIPSAVLTHGNTPVQPGETRISFTQFTAGALFRFIDNGLKTSKQLKAEDPEKYNEVLARSLGQWERGLEMWSMVDEIAKRAGFMVNKM